VATRSPFTLFLATTGLQVARTIFLCRWASWRTDWMLRDGTSPGLSPTIALTGALAECGPCAHLAWLWTWPKVTLLGLLVRTTRSAVKEGLAGHFASTREYSGSTKLRAFAPGGPHRLDT
jgi:hypothetical protein